jgi:UPF0716 family protein affecting phage T7 exclusion
MLSLIGLFLLVGGTIGTAWILLWYLLNASSRIGTDISKKIGTDNERTDEYIETGKQFSKELQQKLIIRASVALIGLAMYYFGSK